MNRKYVLALRILLVMIVGLMALGAGVRVNNAGLSCPDWPLCYGKVIPDYHPVVWFEFVHRAYAGLVAICFLGCAIYAWLGKTSPGVKRAAAVGALFLFFQIAAGALTVLLLVKAVVVTIHLMLATCFFLSVLVMHEILTTSSTRPVLPKPLKIFSALLPFGVFAQIALGGFVASTYAGSVCVDWPLCNGQWIPTLTGAIGLQIVHRFVAYSLAGIIIGFAGLMHLKRNRPWMMKSLKIGTIAAAGVVCIQVAIGIANLLFYIPPTLAVIHQTVAVLLLTISVKFFFATRRTKIL
jgi:cytochrome c oxidase assembly protein subunit 15